MNPTLQPHIELRIALGHAACRRNLPGLMVRLCVLLGLCLGLACNRSQPYIVSSPTGLLTLPSASSVGAIPPPPSSTLPSTPLAEAPRNTASPMPTASDPRFQQLDENNRQLHAQLAQSQQQLQLYKERADLMQRQLQDVTSQLNQARMAAARPVTPTKLAETPAPAPKPESRGFNSETTRKSGARLTANTSSRVASTPFRQLGYEVEEKDGVIRLRIPSDQLFHSNSAQLTPSAAGVLDRVAEIIRSEYPRQRIAIEGHTDNAPLYGGAFATSHQLASAQTNALFDYWTRRHTFPESQLFTLAHGSNFPLQDNQTPVGRAANRRMEIVVYPETY